MKVSPGCDTFSAKIQNGPMQNEKEVTVNHYSPYKPI